MTKNRLENNSRAIKGEREAIKLKYNIWHVFSSTRSTYEVP